jgi:monoamine oxidase
VAAIAPEFDIVVIGAGVAGLAAASVLRDAGCHYLVLEASGRVGGRAWTTRPEALGGAVFDQGAVWLHAAERNPLARIAEGAGETLLDADQLRTGRTHVDGRWANEAERADYDQAWDRFEAAAAQLVGPGLPDVSLAEVARRLPDDPWALTVETWEGPIIAAAAAHELSLEDWRRNLLSGGNLLPEGGLGDIVARRLGAGAAIRLNTPATCVRWKGPGGSVAVETPAGTVTASACIVTVSTGVLAAGGLRFDPPLPPEVAGCIAALPMGLATKVALRATGADRLGLPPFCSVDRRVTQSGEPTMIFSFWPFGRDHAIGWTGGGAAWELMRGGERAAVDFARSELRRLFGARADGVFAESGAVVTGWGADPFVRGAYAYARPGQAGSRARLGEPLADGHLMFAGEACHDGLAGTVGGAYLSGAEAARVAAAAVGLRLPMMSKRLH